MILGAASSSKTLTNCRQKTPNRVATPKKNPPAAHAAPVTQSTFDFSVETSFSMESIWWPYSGINASLSVSLTLTVGARDGEISGRVSFAEVRGVPICALLFPPSKEVDCANPICPHITVAAIRPRCQKLMTAIDTSALIDWPIAASFSVQVTLVVAISPPYLHINETKGASQY